MCGLVVVGEALGDDDGESAFRGSFEKEFLHGKGGAVGKYDFVAMDVVEGVASDLVVDGEELVEDFLQAFDDAGFHVAGGARGGWVFFFGGGCGCGRLCGGGRDGGVGCRWRGSGAGVFWGTRVGEEGKHARKLASLMSECGVAGHL